MFGSVTSAFDNGGVGLRDAELQSDIRRGTTERLRKAARNELVNFGHRSHRDGDMGRRTIPSSSGRMQQSSRPHQCNRTKKITVVAFPAPQGTRYLLHCAGEGAIWPMAYGLWERVRSLLSTECNLAYVYG